MFNLKKQKGFTLIELLVVIAIIILLASISIIALNNQQAKARDARRSSDIRQIRTALEFYASDEGQYPVEVNPIVLGSKGKEKLCAKANGGFVSAETECKTEQTYMTKVPQDPLSGQSYIYTGSEKGYDIIFTTEKTSSLGPAGIYHAHAQAIDTLPGIR